MLSDEWLQRYRLLENFTAKWNGNGNGNGNGNAYDRGDYNSSFALRAVELKSRFSLDFAHMIVSPIINRRITQHNLPDFHLSYILDYSLIARFWDFLNV